MIKKIQSLLGPEADDLLTHKCKGFARESLHLPGPDFIDRVWVGSARSPGVLRSRGVLGTVARKYAHKIPFIVKINHNEMLSYPNFYDQTLFAGVEQAFDLGAVAVGATIYFGSGESRRPIQEISEAFKNAHQLGLATILWCYLRNPAFKTDH